MWTPRLRTPTPVMAPEPTFSKSGKIGFCILGYLLAIEAK